MNVVGTSQLLGESDSYLVYSKPIYASEHKELGRIECLISFGNNEMLDYQKELFMDTLSDLVGGVQQEKTSFQKVQQLFELSLQDINVRLAAFGEKMQEKGPFQISGLLQIFRENQYVSSLIGPASVVVIRKDQVHYRVCQHVADPAPRIDRFNELLEGEIKPDDQLLVIGLPLETYLDKQDMQTVIEQAYTDEMSIEDTLYSLLSSRVDAKKIGFIGSWIVEESPLFAEYRVGRQFLDLWTRFGGKLIGMKKFQHIIIYIMMGLLTLVLLTWIIDSFVTSTTQRYSMDANGVRIDISIEDIQKDIATFKRIDPSSEQKIKKYNEIVAQLDLLERNNKWTVDVQKLRGILEKDYLEGFNIESILDIEQGTEPVYTFTQQELNTFGTLQQLFWNNGLYVAGNEGLLINAIDDQVRGTLVSAGLQRKVDTCSLNLLRNGLYCSMNDGNLFNILRAGLQPMSTSDEAGFGVNINAVGIFGNNFFYTLKNPPAASTGENTFSILRYPVQRGSQDAFGQATRYTLQSDPNFDAAAVGIQSLSIDGTFLVWSPATTSLWQLRRPTAEPALSVRQVPLIGGDVFRAPGPNAKMIATAESRFVYLWDPDSQIFTVYRSSPFKTNTAHTTDYSLLYFFSIKFTLGDTKILDVFVEEGEKAGLYVMTNNQVRKIALGELRERFFAQEEN